MFSDARNTITKKLILYLYMFIIFINSTTDGGLITEIIQITLK